MTVQGLPLIKPPYARITAIDLNRGEIVWQIPHGETPDNIRNHPALKGVNIPRTGRPGRIGTLTTKSLVVAGEGGFFTLPDRRRGAMLRAYDKATGKEVGAVYMPAPQTGIADDVHARRPAVPRRGDRWRQLQQRARRVQAAQRLSARYDASYTPGIAASVLLAGLPGET